MKPCNIFKASKNDAPACLEQDRHFADTQALPERKYEALTKPFEQEQNILT